MKTRTLLAVLALLLTPPIPLWAQTDWDAVEIRVVSLRGGVSMLTAAGGNLGVFLGTDGPLVVDADYAELTPRILSTIGTLPDPVGGTDVPSSPDDPGHVTIRFLVNTHWHFDHTGGNGNFAQAGAVIIAHEAVARLLAGAQAMPALDIREVPASPPEARPTITFNNRMNLSWNGDLIHLIHQPDAHSSGDVIVHFRDADVFHTGDLFFNGMYPYIDVDFGGNLDGMVRAVGDILDFSNETTLFIPGHGPLATRSDLLEYHEMLRTVQDRVRPMVEEGKSREEVLAAKPTADLDSTWARSGNPMEADFFVGLVFDGMVKARNGG